MRGSGSEVGGVVGGGAGWGGAGCAGGCGLFDPPVAGVAGEGQRCGVVGDSGGGQRGSRCGECHAVDSGCAARVRVRCVGVDG